MDFSNYLANKLISATVRGLPYTTPSNAYIALYTDNPTKDDKGTEVVGPSYTRQELVANPPVDGVTNNASQIDWATATTNWGNVTHIGIRDSGTTGSLLYFTKLENAKEILTGDQFRINVNQLKLQLT